MTLTNMPIHNDPPRSTNPQAGVMATRPATAPEAAPTMVGLPAKIHSITAQLRVAAAVAVLVVTNACAARPLAANAEPALKPNQPNHSNAAPMTTKGTLCIPG